MKGGKLGDDGSKKDFYLSEATVKAAKDLVYHQKQKDQSLGKVRNLIGYIKLYD